MASTICPPIPAGSWFDMMDDHDLIILMRTGNENAYSALIKRYTPKIKRLALSILKSEQEAEDAAQDIIFSLWQKLHDWDIEGSAKFSTWLYRVATNKCIDLKRKHKPTTTTDNLELQAEDKSAYQQILKNQLSDQLAALLETLPAMQNLTLRLYYYEELSVKEISDRLNKTDQSIRSLLKRGKASLKERMAQKRHSQILEFSKAV